MKDGAKYLFLGVTFVGVAVLIFCALVGLQRIVG
jgi:hypothetical protein